MKRPTKEELEYNYITEDMRQNEIAAIYGVSRQTINDWLREYDIPRKGMSKSAKLRKELTGMVAGYQVKETPMYEDF